MLKSFCVRVGPCGEKGFSKRVRLLISADLTLAQVWIESLVKVYEDILSEVDRLTKNITEVVTEDAGVRRLMTVPGIGAIRAINFKVELGDPKRFKDPHSVGAYFGMIPREYSLGKVKRLGGILRCGSKEVRSLLTERTRLIFDIELIALIV